MIRTAILSLGALSLVAVARTPLRAQSAAASVQLAFGYECGDRFMVRNDGDNPVLVEYAVAGSQDKSQLHLAGRQSAEIASAQSGNMELWVNGKVVASEPKGNIACAPAKGAAVAPPAQADQAAAPADSAYSAAPVVVYAPPPCYYDGCYPYPYYYPNYYPYYGFGSYFYPSIGFYGRIGGGRGGVRGPAFRGRGGRR